MPPSVQGPKGEDSRTFGPTLKFPEGIRGNWGDFLV